MAEDSLDTISRLFGPGTMSLAPMVRAGRLPLRLLSYYYGADAVYAEELIDFKMIKTTREVDDKTNMIYYRAPRNNSKSGELQSVFATCPLEKDRLVFQVGSANATRALKTFRIVGGDIAAFDLNMGCPKHFSIQAGMGAALLGPSPETAEDILKTLRRNSTIPITCKVRLLDDDKKTVEMLKRLEAAGAQAIGVHLREKHHRPREPALWDRLKNVRGCTNVPILANGDVYSRDDAEKVCAMGGESCAAMLARGALKNPSVFLPGKLSGTVPIFDVMRNYTVLSKRVDNHLANTVYTLVQMFRYNNKSVNMLPCAIEIKNGKQSFERLFELLETGPVQVLQDEPISWQALDLIPKPEVQENSVIEGKLPLAKKRRIDA